MKNNDKVGFYILHNPNTDETYVGSGVLDKRKKTHDYFLKNNDHYNYKLQEAYNKDPNFDFVAVPTETREEAFDAEQSIINEFKGNPLLLNISLDARVVSVGKHSDETKEKNRQATKKRWEDPEWRIKVINAQNNGKALMTDEQKLLRKESLVKALKQSHASGTRIPTLGQTRSIEFCEQNSNKIKEKWKDPEYQETQRLARIGKMIGPNKKPVNIDGTQYNSIAEAASAFGMSVPGVMYRLNNDNYTNWNYA